jgi:hypothetical protein
MNRLKRALSIGYVCAVRAFFLSPELVSNAYTTPTPAVEV